ncbi:MAG TPA: hypothetical protein VF808_04160 [Ktedonobacterales bacterium]
MTSSTPSTTPATSFAATASRATAPASRLQVAGVVVLAAGIGWLNGNFIQPIPPAFGLVIDLLHLTPLLILVPLAMSLMTRGVTRGVRNGVTGVVAFLLAACVAFIVLGAVNPDPNSVGVHDVTDWAVVASITTGSVLWLVSLLPSRTR